MKKILLTGKNGQIGWELERTLAPVGQLFAFARTGLDLSDTGRISSVIRSIRPDVIVNAAAYTAVDKAESEVQAAMAINSEAPGVLAEEAKRIGALLVHYSTDYVFDGRKQGPYTEDDVPNPVNAYGRTKLAGERAIQAIGGRHLILRTTWIYGMRGQNFLRTMLRLARERDELRVVDDQTGAPTWSRMVAEASALVLARTSPPEGLLHLTCQDKVSWCGFTEKILEHTRKDRQREPRLTPIRSLEYPLPATRPANSCLDCSRFHQQTGFALPSWNDALRLCLSS